MEASENVSPNNTENYHLHRVTFPSAVTGAGANKTPLLHIVPVMNADCNLSHQRQSQMLSLFCSVGKRKIAKCLCWVNEKPITVLAVWWPQGALVSSVSAAATEAVSALCFRLSQASFLPTLVYLCRTSAFHCRVDFRSEPVCFTSVWHFVSCIWTPWVWKIIYEGGLVF